MTTNKNIHRCEDCHNRGIVGELHRGPLTNEEITWDASTNRPNKITKTKGRVVVCTGCRARVHMQVPISTYFEALALAGNYEGVVRDIKRKLVPMSDEELYGE